MRAILVVFLLAGCESVIQMPAPVAYSGACPKDDSKCQRNLDAQTLHYIGESDAAVMLLCQNKELRQVIESCEIPAVY